MVVVVEEEEGSCAEQGAVEENRIRMAGEEVVGLAVAGSPVGSTSSPIGGKDLARWAAQPPSVAEDRTVDGRKATVGR